MSKSQSRKRVEPALTDARRALLTTASQDAGLSWAKKRRDLIIRDGRQAEGGWPGTLSEARDLAASFLTPAVRSSLSSEELAWMVRATYAQARRHWLMLQNR